MKFPLFLACAVLLVAVGLPAESIVSASLPVPPEQGQPWTPPATTISPLTIGAIEELFRQGLADPRGCDYREIEIVVGDGFGGFGPFKTHGWVLPSSGGSKFGITWNGLVYPLESVGELADLRADTQVMIQRDQAWINQMREQIAPSEEIRKRTAQKEGAEYTPSTWPLRWNRQSPSERDAVTWQGITPVKAALLLRLGQGDLAGKVWDQWFSVPTQQQDEDPYLTLATSWVWSNFDRAIRAHSRGDDGLAVASAKALITIQAAVEAEAARRNFNRPHGDERSPKPVPYLGFLRQLPDMLNDGERRLAHPRTPPVLPAANPLPVSERIASLIRDLDLAGAGQERRPGGGSLSEDPLVMALIQSGDAAVEPLLECLENDTRLTRYVDYERRFTAYHTVLGVPEAAYVALAEILKTRFFGPPPQGDRRTVRDKEGRKNTAAEIRAYWKKYRDLPLLERWYQTLADDNASPSDWLQAAGNIVQESGGNSPPYDSLGTLSAISPQSTTVPVLQGESLRSRTNPSVGELLVRRINGRVSEERPEGDAKTRFAVLLAQWDGKAHYPELRKVSEELEKRLSASLDYREHQMANILTLYRARIQAGDPQALPDYARWVLTISPEGFGHETRKLLTILWQHPGDPAMRQMAEKLFGDVSSPWVSFLIKGNNRFDELLSSPLVGLPAFRKELLRGLSDQTEIGTVMRASDTSINLVFDGGGRGSWSDSAYAADSSASAVGSEVRFRVCDFYASKISLLEGTPAFQLFWPKEKRDAALPAVDRFVRRYGKLFQYEESDAATMNIFNQARIHFAKLPGPATADDVEDGRAIFSAKGKRRLWPMSEFPMKASWTTLRENPSQATQFDSVTGEQKFTIYYETTGWVFQAEEVLVDGKWERFFGFVGRHQIARVPAAEMEFPGDWGMGMLSHGFDCQLLGPGQVERTGRLPMVKMGLDAPMPLEVKIRNRSGLDQAVPGALLLPDGATEKLPSAVEFELSRAEFTNLAEWDIPESAWQAVPPRSGLTQAPPEPVGPILSPSGEFTILKADLRDFFTMDRPGLYRLQAKFKVPDGVQGASPRKTFSVGEKDENPR